jgi:hypothetical protein
MGSFGKTVTAPLGLMFMLVGVASADTAPEVRPGLWETRIVVKGDMIEALEAQIASMPMEIQQEMHQKMSELAAPENECITPAQAKTYFDDILTGDDCTNKVEWKGQGRGTLTSTCRDGDSQTSEIVVENAKKMSVVSTFVEGGDNTSTSTWDGRWLADDCGDVLPEE